MGGLFRRLLPCMNRHELPLDGWIIQERVLCHRLESTPRLPAPAACTPLEIYRQKPRYEYPISSNQHALSGHALKCTLSSYSGEWANAYYHDFSSNPKTWFKSNPRSNNRIPKPNSRTAFTSFKSSNFHILSPEPAETWSKSSMNHFIIARSTSKTRCS